MAAICNETEQNLGIYHAVWLPRGEEVGVDGGQRAGPIRSSPSVSRSGWLPASRCHTLVPANHYAKRPLSGAVTAWQNFNVSADKPPPSTQHLDRPSGSAGRSWWILTQTSETVTERYFLLRVTQKDLCAVAGSVQCVWEVPRGSERSGSVSGCPLTNIHTGKELNVLFYFFTSPLLLETFSPLCGPFYSHSVFLSLCE